MIAKGIAEEANEAAEHFRVATGISCVAVAPDGRRLPETDSATGDAEPSAACAFCGLLRQNGENRFESCSGIHHYGIVQAERFGGSYLYFCPLNMTHWAAPIHLAGITVAALIGGPVLMVKHDDYLQADLYRFPGISQERLDALKTAVRRIEYVDTKKTRSLAAVLFMEAQAVSARLGGDCPRKEGPVRTEEARSFGPVRKPKIKYPRYPISKERELLTLITKGDLDGSRKALNEILDFIFFYSNHELDTIKLRVQELVVLLSRAAIDGGASIDEIIGLNDRYLRWLQEARSVYDLSSTLAVLLTRFVECVFTLKSVKHADLIQKAVRYVNANFAKNLTLEEVAFHVGLSGFHLSRLFREDTGDTFIGFLTKLRVRACKELLADSSVALSEIGPRVGFEDQSYFTRVFKKMTGMSPGQYRKRKGLEEGSPLVDESNIEIHD